MSAREAELFKLQQAGATEEQLAGLKKLDAQLVDNENLKKLQDEGKSLFMSMMTPLEKYENELAKLDDLLAAGAITKETFNRASKKAGEEYGNTNKETQLAGSHERAVQRHSAH